MWDCRVLVMKSCPDGTCLLLPRSSSLSHHDCTFVCLPLFPCPDAFDATEAETGQKRVIQSMVHIRNQQRNNRKSLTTIAGLAEDLDLTRILKFMRKVCQPLERICDAYELDLSL